MECVLDSQKEREAAGNESQTPRYYERKLMKGEVADNIVFLLCIGVRSE